MLQHVERLWDYVSNDPADATNNATERLIGLTFKIPSKTMTSHALPLLTPKPGGILSVIGQGRSLGLKETSKLVGPMLQVGPVPHIEMKAK